MEGVEEVLCNKEEEDGGHVVALMDSGGIVDFGEFFADFNFNCTVIVELFDNLGRAVGVGGELF